LATATLLVIMSSFMKSEQLRAKFIELVKEQTETLEKQVFGGLTDNEMRDYRRRQERIRDLRNQLRESKRAA
jgi:hypothetical protein